MIRDTDHGCYSLIPVMSCIDGKSVSITHLMAGDMLVEIHDDSTGYSEELLYSLSGECLGRKPNLVPV